MGILFWSLEGETPRCWKPLLLCVWPQLLLPSLKQRLMLMHTCTVAMAAMVLAMDIMGQDTADSMASVRLKLSPRLMPMPTCTTEDTMAAMVLAILAMDTMGLDTADSMASVRLSPRLMLMPTCTEDTKDMVLAMVAMDTMGLDTADSMESVRPMPSLRLMPTCIEDMLDMLDTTDMLDTMDTHMLDILTWDKLLSKTTITRWNQRAFFFFLVTTFSA